MSATALLLALPVTAGAVPEIQAATPQASAIRDFDFLNGTFDSPLAEGPVRVRNGFGKTAVSSFSVQVAYGDLDGDAMDDAAVLWQDDGAVASSTGVLTFRFQRGDVHPLLTLTGGAAIDGYLKNILIEYGELITISDPEQSQNAEPCNGQVVRHFVANGQLLEVRQQYCDDGSDPSSPAVRARMPEDLRAFVMTRQACDHFRGEPVEGDDPEAIARRQFVADKIAETCSGTDQQLATLKRRYADDLAFAGALAVFEEQIEFDDGSADHGASARELRAGEYGPLTIGFDPDQGIFSAVLMVQSQPGCSVRLRGLAHLDPEPLAAKAELHRDAFGTHQTEEAVFAAELKPGQSTEGTPTLRLRLGQLPDHCPELSTFASEQGVQLTQTLQAPWTKVQWVNADRAYFHQRPAAEAKGATYVIKGDLVRQYGEHDVFVDAAFVNAKGLATRGWLKFEDLVTELWLGDGAEM
ncbi:hypothetical protein C7S18_07890 [Ahniella affigens]|uniref:Uncharacterized protein n=1 Tax=Ahniella affigens TaxID=2021234 RepID=A0A2P1PQJ1_9GAMM|nr:hypothetical protein [Ahniella affigens]AVP97117.1 hypothetical protein C7S18_07890 [Ahniella affigens]